MWVYPPLSLHLFHNKEVFIPPHLENHDTTGEMLFLLIRTLSTAAQVENKSQRKSPL